VISKIALKKITNSVIKIIKRLGRVRPGGYHLALREKSTQDPKRV
jgi:hypothetical protein